MDTCKAKVVGFIVLLVVLTYQLLCFLAFVAFAIGFSVVASNVYEYIMGAILPSFIETFVCMYLLSVFAEFHIYCQNECVGASFAAYYRTYPNLLMMGTMVAYTFLYLLSFSELYIQFEDTHVVRGSIQGDRVKGEDGQHRENLFPDGAEEGHGRRPRGTGTTESEQLHTAAFLLALSYIVYCTMKLIQLDVIHQVRRIANQASCIHCIVTLGFLGVHFVMNILYSIPLVIVAFSVHLYECSGSMAFVSLNAVGILSGIIFAVMETRRPWPVVRSLGPFYLYENNARAKAVLGQLQILLILIFFYRPFNNGKILPPVTAGNTSVLYFCFFVAFTMLHYIKILVFIIVQKEEAFIPEMNDIGDGEGLFGADADDGDDMDAAAAVIVEMDPNFNLGSDSRNSDEVESKKSKKPDPNDNEQQAVQDATNMNQAKDLEEGAISGSGGQIDKEVIPLGWISDEATKSGNIPNDQIISNPVILSGSPEFKTVPEEDTNGNNSTA